MAKKAITFKTAWSRYNAGETAAFDAKQADDLIANKKAVLAKDQPKSEIIHIDLSVNVRDSAEFKEIEADFERRANGLAQLSEDLDARQVDLDARAAELDAKAADLAAREAGLAEREASAAPSKADEAPAPDAVAKAAPEAAGKAPALPKQGR